jgi:hypothetical protein
MRALASKGEIMFKGILKDVAILFGASAIALLIAFIVI